MIEKMTKLNKMLNSDYGEHIAKLYPRFVSSFCK